MTSSLTLVYPYMPFLAAANVNLYELNLLAQRLTMLSEDDRMGLDGLLQIESRQHIGPIPLPRLINLTYNTDICTLAPYVSDIQELGALLYLHGVDPESLEDVDGERAVHGFG